MQSRIYLSLILCWTAIFASAQTTILNFETPATSTVFQYFGSTLDGSTNSIIPNPNPTGINMSANVAKFVKPAGAQVWAGGFSNPNPTQVVDLVANAKIKVKVHMDHIGNLTLKLEESSNGGQNWAVTVQNTKINEWEELTFDANIPSIEPPNLAAKDHIYAKVVLFFDFGTAGGAADVVSYFDDVVTVAEPVNLVCNAILDFEAPATSTVFQYFGSSLDGSTNSVITNPNPTGINVSAKVAKFVKPAGALVYAGAFSNPNPTQIVDFINNTKIKIKVHMDHIGSLSLKLEDSPDGGTPWIITVPNTKINEWEELTFNASTPSIEGNIMPATGHTYPKVVLFFDFGTAGGAADVVSYFDEVCQVGSGVATPKAIKFKVDMNSYSGNFDTVYVSGTFNNWSGNANKLTDANADGIWEGTVNSALGVQEYKITLDNWANQESFGGFEECTVKDPSGEFVNRKLVVTADVELPKFCYNSCYACGDEVKLTFRLGMGTVVPSPDGVWIVGGGNFDVPGGKYKMKDPENDGIYEIVVPRQKGFSSYFAFANGACPDYSCKENLAGLPCGVPNNFNDRFLPAVQTNLTFSTCFGLCSTNVACTSVGSQDLKNTKTLVELWGNPTSTQSILFFKDLNDVKFVTIYNAIGQVISRTEVNAQQERLDIFTQDLPEGFYEINVRCANQFQTLKLVK